MASGKKNYFRHSFFARNDEFICDLIDNFGLQGYYYYFALLEMCGEQSSEELQERYKFHKRILVHSLRLNTRKLNLFLTYLQDKFKISYTYIDNQYEIIIPNLSKYLGKYSSKNTTNSTKERKEKERKENITKDDLEPYKYTYDDVQKEYLKIFTNQKRISLAPAKSVIQNFVESQKYIPDLETWINVFLKAKNNKFCNGESGWQVTLPWLCNYDNFYKVESGQLGGNVEIKTQAQLEAESQIDDQVVNVLDKNDDSWLEDLK